MQHVEFDPELDRWYLRFTCDGRDATTIYFDLRPRSLRYEVYFLPDPLKNIRSCTGGCCGATTTSPTTPGSRSGPTATSTSPGACSTSTSTRRSSTASSASATRPSRRGSRPRSLSVSDAVSGAGRGGFFSASPAPKNPLRATDRAGYVAPRRYRWVAVREARPEVQAGLLRSGKCGGSLQWFLGPCLGSRWPCPPRRCLVQAIARPEPHAGSSLRCVTTLALLGGGKMGEALIGGLVDGGWDPENLAVAEVAAERRHAIESRFAKVRVVPNPAWAVAEAEIVVVAVKPGDVPAALEAAEPVLEAGGAGPVDRRRGHAGHARGRWCRAGPSCGPCPTPRRWSGWGRRPSPPGPTPVRSTWPGPRRSSSLVGDGGARPRAPARRRDRPVGLGARLRVPRGRGADRGRRLRRAAPAGRARRW